MQENSFDSHDFNSFPINDSRCNAWLKIPNRISSKIICQNARIEATLQPLLNFLLQIVSRWDSASLNRNRISLKTPKYNLFPNGNHFHIIVTRQLCFLDYHLSKVSTAFQIQHLNSILNQAKPITPVTKVHRSFQNESLCLPNESPYLFRSTLPRILTRPLLFFLSFIASINWLEKRDISLDKRTRINSTPTGEEFHFLVPLSADLGKFHLVGRGEGPLVCTTNAIMIMGFVRGEKGKRRYIGTRERYSHR